MVPNNPYTKPHLPVVDQLRLLQSRGLVVTDVPRALQCLERIGYYRLSGYWYPFRQVVPGPLINGRRSQNVRDQFVPGTEFQHVMYLYVFDKRLRLLFLDAIERIEVALRVDIALRLGARDTWAHRNPNELHGNFAKKIDFHSGLTLHQKWLSRLDDNEKRSKEDFVVHFRNRYTSPLPIWMSIELWDFGILSTFVSGMKVSDLNAMLNKYGISRHELLTSWMRSFNYIRNVCAHHSRLWNRSPADQPKIPRLGENQYLDHLVNDTQAQTRIYAIAATIQLFLRTINPTTSWSARLKTHMATFPDNPGISIRHTGFPLNWETLRLWS